MKFTIATIHSAYAFPFSPDGRDVATELSQGVENFSAVNINWLKPVESYNYNAEILLNKEIEGLDNVSSSLVAYFEEQFSDVDNPLLWMPSFHLNQHYYKNYLSKSVVDTDNILSQVVQKMGLTELEVIVFHLGEDSLKNISHDPVQGVIGSTSEGKMNILFYELPKKSPLSESLVKNYSLSKYEETDLYGKSWKYLHETSVESFEKYGKLLNPNDKASN